MSEVALNVTLRNLRQHGSPVRASPPPDEVMPNEYPKTVLGSERRLEFLSRPTTLDMRGWNPYSRPTSLFFQAAHTAFMTHYPLALRPEVLWHQVMAEVATCVKLHPESYRSLFTTLAADAPGQTVGSEDTSERKGGKIDIHIEADDLVMGRATNDWAGVIGQFEAALSGLVPGDIQGTLLPTFSTTTPETRTASLITFMAAASPFYDFHCHTLCGIPNIRLLGKVGDYEQMVVSAEKLAPLFQEHLGSYFARLIPTLKKLVTECSTERPDENFWASIYNHRSESGTSKISGWLTDFAYYLSEVKGTYVKYDFKVTSGELVPKKDSQIPVGSIPSQVSTCPFIWHYYGQRLEMTFFAGPLAIVNDDGFLCAELGYGVAHG